MAESTSHASSGDIDSHRDDREEPSTSSASTSDESSEDDHTGANKNRLSYFLERLPKPHRERIEKEVDEDFKQGQVEY